MANNIPFSDDFKAVGKKSPLAKINDVHASRITQLMVLSPTEAKSRECGVDRRLREAAKTPFKTVAVKVDTKAKKTNESSTTASRVMAAWSKSIKKREGST